MHSEHITNLHPGWVVGGWLVAVAVSSAGFMILVGLGLLDADSARAAFLVPAAVAVGFFLGGLFVGMRWSDAPILHGVAITVLTVLVWFVGELLVPEAMAPGMGTPEGEGSTFVLGMILLQLVVTVAGAWTGRWMVLRGRTPSLEG